MRPRPYQVEADRRVMETFQGRSSALVVLPTGCGKTVLFASIARRFAPARRVMVIAHREELIYQAANTIATVTGERPAIEMAEYRAGGGLFEQPPVVVGSVQTLCRPSRLAKFDPAEFGLVVVDEAHHDTPQNATYRAVRNHFAQNPDCRFLGVTATPDRADRLALGQSYESVAFNLELPDAIDQGWLVPIKQSFIQVQGLDFSRVRTTAGDLNQGDLEKVLACEPTVCHEVASSVAQIAGNRKTLIFCVSVAHAQVTTDILNRMGGGRAACLTGESDRDIRRLTLEQFARGELQYLVGCAIFTEGFDEPSIEVVAVARPTKSRALYTQMVGRGTRTLKGLLTPDMNDSPAATRLAAIASSRKPAVEVIDLVGNSGRHALVTSADILAGRWEKAAVARAVAQAQRGGKAVDMRAAAQAAQESMDREEAERKRREAEAQQRQAEADRREAERRRKGVYGEAKFHTREVDPFGRRVNEYQDGPSRSRELTEKQKAILHKNGYDPAAYKFEEAQRILNQLFASWKGDAISPKQQQTLQRFGESGPISKAKGTVLFALLKARNWRARDFRLTKDRLSIRPQSGKYVPVVNDPKAGPVPISERQFSSEQACREFLSQVVETE